MKITRYVRFSRPSQSEGRISYGILEGESIQEVRGDIFAGAEPTDKTFNVKDVRLLAPCAPVNVAAVGRNYQTHIKAMDQLRDRSTPPAEFPGLFWKPASCIIGTEENILLPAGAENAD